MNKIKRLAELFREKEALAKKLTETNCEEVRAELSVKQQELDNFLRVAEKPTFHVFLGGPPGAGKSAFVGEFKEHFPYAKVIASGNICRMIAAEDSERGHQARKYVSEGELVPLHLFIDEIETRLHQALKESHIVVWDGFPRTHEQERVFHQMTIGGKTAIVLKDAPAVEIMDRIINNGRKQCLNPICGREYDISATKCVCGSSLIVRPDDNPVMWFKRYRYHAKHIAEMQRSMFADLFFISNDKESHRNIIDVIRSEFGI